MELHHSDVFGYFLMVVKMLMIFVSVVFILSGLDDLFIDLCFAVRSLFRRLFVTPRYPPLSEQQLLDHPEQAIAVMLPAWDESAVIRPMLENAVKSINYRNFHIFVGTYPNDTDTQREVERVREKYDNVHRIVTPHDGPTNKADCLNWIYQGIKLYEKEKGIRFEIFIMQDCEDVIHPLCYKLFNYLIPRKDMVQLPVHSLKRKWHQLTAGHYIDEFAQLHSKDLVVREFLNRSIPAAGVGVAFSRRAFETVAANNRNQLFSIDSLTEDYDFGFRLKQFGMKQVFVRFHVERTVMKPGFFSRRPRPVRVKELICIREYFPSGFWAAVRQKSRWVLGIGLQGWANLGWQGGFWTKYMLFRDRKALLTNLVNLLGYLVVFTVLTVWLVIYLRPEAYHYPPLLEKDSLLWYTVIANAFLFLGRVVVRAICVQRLHGWVDAFLSLPRMVWGNIINFAATWRALSLYLRYLRTGKIISWDKTSHVFPSEDELKAFNHKLGDVLLERKLITVKQLEEALVRQAQTSTHRLLGSILIELGAVSETELMAVVEARAR